MSSGGGDDRTSGNGSDPDGQRHGISDQGGAEKRNCAKPTAPEDGSSFENCEGDQTGEHRADMLGPLEKEGGHQRDRKADKHERRRPADPPAAIASEPASR